MNRDLHVLPLSHDARQQTPTALFIPQEKMLSEKRRAVNLHRRINHHALVMLLPQKIKRSGK